MGMILTILLAAALLLYAIWAFRRVKKQGLACSGGCTSCPMAGKCHGEKQA